MIKTGLEIDVATQASTKLDFMITDPIYDLQSSLF